MSEKRLIDVDELMYIAFKAESSHDVTEYFNALPVPTLRSICGKRTLDSMDGDEINELLAMLFPTGTRECSIDFREQDGQQAYQITLSDQDYHTWYITIGMGYFSAVCADDDIGGSIHPAKLIKWFIEKGFDVFGGVE